MKQGVQVLVLLVVRQLLEKPTFAGVVDPVHLELVEKTTANNAVEAVEDLLGYVIGEAPIDDWAGLHNQSEQIHIVSFSKSLFICLLILLIKCKLINLKPNCR